MTLLKKLCAVLLLVTAMPSLQAQEGHPLVGTWQGTWGADDNFLTLILTWDGVQLHGIVNPGPDSSELGQSSVDSSTWHVQLDMPVTDNNGATAALTLDGTINNIGSRLRTLTGTWRRQGQSGPFTLQRQNGA